MSKPIGIDLGTSNTVTAVYRGQTPTIIPTTEGNRSFPSVVGIDALTGRVIVGATARRQAPLNPRGTIYSVKRLMGKKFDEVQKGVAHLPYEVVRAPNGDAHVRVGKQLFAPAEISAFILKKAKNDAESFLQGEVKSAIITVPAYFDDRQRKATQEAGHMAGLEVLRIINEPTAAAIAYCLARPKGDCGIAVVHLGGGTLDISILEVGEGVFEVKSVCGDTQLGGDDFDQCIIDWAAEELCRTHGHQLSSDSTLAEMLKWEAEKAKCDLSELGATDLFLPYVRIGSSLGYETISLTLFRSTYEERAKPLIERIIRPCKQAMTDSGLEYVEVEHVILVGQQTRMPAVQQAVERVFNRKPRRDIDPAEVVAMGASIQAGVFSGDVKDVLLLDVTPFTMGIETTGGVFTPVLKRNNTIPTSIRKIFTTSSDSQTNIMLRVYRGEEKMTAKNKCIGELTLDGIPPAPQGMPKIEVTFSIDANGIIQVSGKDLATGSERSIFI